MLVVRNRYFSFFLRFTDLEILIYCSYIYVQIIIIIQQNIFLLGIVLYIRWIARKHKNTHAADMTFHDAYLVESYRDEIGKPRQRTIGYLGNIREIEGEFPNVERELFLSRAKAILQSMEDLSSDDYEHVLEHLYRRVPPLTQNEVIFAFQQNLRWFYQWCDQNNTHAPSADELYRLIESAKRQPEPF